MHRQAAASGYKFMLSPRCGAKTRWGTACLSPAVRGRNRCRMHGGAKGSGAPKGSQNALKHGFQTAEAKEQRRYLKGVVKECADFIEMNS